MKVGIGQGRSQDLAGGGARMIFFRFPITKNTTGIRGIYITITSTTMVFANEKTRFTTITSTTITFTITNFTANIFLNYYKYFKIIS